MIKNRTIEREPVLSEYFQDESIHSGFLSCVEKYPNHVALTIKHQTYTYAELDETARKWASIILTKSDFVPQRIGIFAYRSNVSYIGVLASLYAGAAFVPLNRKFPIERTAAMIESAALDAVIVDKESAAQFLSILKDLKRVPACVLFPDFSKANFTTDNKVNIWDEDDLEQVNLLLNLPVHQKNRIAYLLFTSGSTGLPKGVPIAHSNAVHFLKVNQKRYHITPNDRFSQTFDQTFDLSIFDLFMAWSNGARVCAMEPIDLLYPFKYIQEQRITIWFSVPSIAALLRKQDLLKRNSFPGLRLSLFCGEALHRSVAEKWQEAAPNSVVENLYGPTELTIACAVYQWKREVSPMECRNEIVPIGQVYEGLHALIVDDDLMPVPQGMDGELCICGPQTFPGYWNNEDETRKRMVEVKSHSGELNMYYRTGDRVLRLSNNNMVYLGRMDHQVKVQGYRVELSEIEGILSTQPGVIMAAALAWPIHEGTAKGIVAFVTGNINTLALTSVAKQKLPMYMVPKKIYSLKEMPLNANGKIDRKQLFQWLETRKAIEGEQG